MIRLLIAALIAAIAIPAAQAGEADVVAVKYEQGSDGTYTFHVTVRHDDTGWDHYADKWEVAGPDGTVYGERVLLHPHETEQPFTRSQSGIAIPDDVTEVTVRAHDKVHEWGGEEMTVELKGSL